MQRCISLDEIRHFFGLILDNVVHSTANHSGLNVSASACPKTFCHLGDQRCKR
jgi:hypothetical protein